METASSQSRLVSHSGDPMKAAVPRDLLLAGTADGVATVANLGHHKLPPDQERLLGLLLRHMAPPADLEGISHLDPKHNNRLLAGTPPDLKSPEPQCNSDAHTDAHLLASRNEAPMADHSIIPRSPRRWRSQLRRPTCLQWRPQSLPFRMPTRLSKERWLPSRRPTRP